MAEGIYDLSFRCYVYLALDYLKCITCGIRANLCAILLSFTFVIDSRFN
jgi:hypothetical protein